MLLIKIGIACLRSVQRLLRIFNLDGATNDGEKACLDKDKDWDSTFSGFKFDIVNSVESGKTTVM